MAELISDCSILPKRFVKAVGEDIIGRIPTREDEIAKIQDELVAELTKWYRVTIERCAHCKEYIAGGEERWPPTMHEVICCVCCKIWCMECTKKNVDSLPAICHSCRGVHCVECCHVQ